MGEPLVSLCGFLRSPLVRGPTDDPHAARLSSFSARCMAAGTFGLGLSPAPHGRRAWDIHLEALVEDDQASLHKHDGVSNLASQVGAKMEGFRLPLW
jgi:hypothetical protein